MLGNMRVFDCSCFCCAEVVDKLRTPLLRGKSSLTSSSTNMCQKGIYKTTARALEMEEGGKKALCLVPFSACKTSGFRQRCGCHPFLP